jgi:hypothetical protein
MKFALLLILYLLIFNIGFAQWIDLKIYDKDSNDNYINPSYIQKVNEGNRINIKKAWVKSTSKNYVDNDGKKYDGVETMELWLIDCQKFQTKLISVTFYSNTGDVLENIKSSARTNNQWEDIMPESVAEQLFKKICSLNKK